MNLQRGRREPKSAGDRVRARRRRRGRRRRPPRRALEPAAGVRIRWRRPRLDRRRFSRLHLDAMERCGNRRPRVERLVSAWNQGTRGDTDPAGERYDPLIGASAEPKKRPRTRLTDEEVDAMRTARAHEVGVNALARQFGVHRGTVWAKTR
jgi:predicted DNA-binding protein (UPF0251 family)